MRIYATTIYSNSLYAGIPALNELIPTALILFYVVFLTAYHHETQERTKAELQSAAQAALFKQAQTRWMHCVRHRCWRRFTGTICATT